MFRYSCLQFGSEHPSYLPLQAGSASHGAVHLGNNIYHVTHYTQIVVQPLTTTPEDPRHDDSQHSPLTEVAEGSPGATLCKLGHDWNTGPSPSLFSFLWRGNKWVCEKRRANSREQPLGDYVARHAANFVHSASLSDAQLRAVPVCQYARAGSAEVKHHLRHSTPHLSAVIPCKQSK